MELKLEQAQELVKKALEKAATEFKKPICVTIVDRFGFLLAFARMDKAPIRSIRISFGKAYTAARMETNTDTFLERLQKENITPAYFCDEKLTGLPGGAVIKNKEGNIIGAIGISGLTLKEDQMIASSVAAS
jgi:glc operon protein GlcG